MNAILHGGPLSGSKHPGIDPVHNQIRARDRESGLIALYQRRSQRTRHFDFVGWVPIPERPKPRIIVPDRRIVVAP